MNLNDLRLDLTDRFAWGLYFLQERLFVRCSPMHKEIATAPGEHNRVAIAGFRYGAKSTWGTLLTALYEATQEPMGLIRISSNTSLLAEEQLRQIKKELRENKFLLDAYPFLSQKWQKDGADEIILPNGVRIQARGFMHIKRGDHPDREIIDDPEDKLEVKSETIRENFHVQWGTVEGSWTPQTKVLYIANYLHPLCFTKKLIENSFDPATGVSSADWYRIKYESGYHVRKPIWPEKWPMEELEKKRSAMGWQAFDAEFENRPEFFLEPVIKPEWFKHYSPNEITAADLREATLYITYDAAFSLKESADYWVAGLWVKFHEGEKAGRIYLLKHVNNRALVDDNCRGMLGWVLENSGKPAIVHFQREGKDYLFVKQSLERLVRQERMNLSQPEVQRDDHPGDKRQRLMSVSGMFQDGKVYFPAGGSEIIENQILMLGEGDFDDYVDMVSDGCYYAKQIVAPRKKPIQFQNLSYQTIRRAG